MSMPSFPPNGADLTREEALTMIIASIAMEELALSHILNAEGEKLQYILGTLPGAKPCACPQDVLAVNKSVASLLDVVAQNQMLLKGKLEKVLEACPGPAPSRPAPLGAGTVPAPLSACLSSALPAGIPSALSPGLPPTLPAALRHGEREQVQPPPRGAAAGTALDAGVPSALAAAGCAGGLYLLERV